jgi:hypothetical protein
MLAAGRAAFAQFTHPKPMQRTADEYQALLMERNYDRLEKEARAAFQSGSVIADGQPRLAAIFDGTAGCICDNIFTDELWQIRRARLEEWRSKKPNSVAAKLANAVFPLQYGWFARGGGFSNTVSDEGRQLFDQRVEQARLALEAVDPEVKNHPVWYAAMLDVGIAQHWDSARFWALYREAVGKFPKYLPIYFSGASYISPKWYGSQDEFRVFVEEAVSSTRAKWGYTLYARLNWSEASDNMFRSGQADWKQMRAGFDRIIKDYPDPWNVNKFAVFACMAEDAKTLARLIPRIGRTPIKAAWGSVEYYSQCRALSGKT